MENSALNAANSRVMPGHRHHVRLPSTVPEIKRSWKERLWPGRKPRMVFDPRLCNGCGDCVNACANRDPLHPDSARIEILRAEQAGSNFAVFCQHCLDPPCVRACPQKAVNRAGNGIVGVDSRLCAHCGLCIEACPEAAPQRAKDGRVLKCDLCNGHPICVDACTEKALAYTRGKALGWIRFLRWPVQTVAFLFMVIILVGTVCSLNVGEWSLSCPLGVLQNIAASKLILLSTIAAALFMVVLALMAGRAACGWLCPFGFLLDLVGKVMPRKFLLPVAVRTRMAKYGVAAAAIGVSGAVSYQAFCTLCPIGTLCRSYGVQGVVGGAELAIVPAIASLETSEKRTWCRYLCPVGALLALCAKIGLLKIVIGAPRCKKFSCMRCAETCPMGIVPESDLREGISPRLNMSECIMCLRCIDSCPHGAVKIRLRWQKPHFGKAGEMRFIPEGCESRDGGGQCLR